MAPTLCWCASPALTRSNRLGGAPYQKKTCWAYLVLGLETLIHGMIRYCCLPELWSLLHFHEKVMSRWSYGHLDYVIKHPQDVELSIVRTVLLLELFCSPKFWRTKVFFRKLLYFNNTNRQRLKNNNEWLKYSNIYITLKLLLIQNSTTEQKKQRITCCWLNNHQTMSG